MSVNINWNSLEQESLLLWSKELLNDALNSGKRPNILASNIEIQDLHFGHNAPIVEILEVGDLDSDKFRGIFKIKYAGDSYINLATKIQANPMNIYYNNSIQQYSDFVLPDLGMVSQPFKIPINLKLSKIALSGIIIIVFNKSKGLTLVFKNDPLESIHVSSTFDAIPAIRNFLQAQIENQIRDLFREVLPNVLYKVSQKWTQNIHSQLLSNSGAAKDKKEKVVLFSDINPDGPDLSPANLLRLSTLCASRQSLSLSTPMIKDYIQRSTVEKFLSHNMVNNNQNSFFLMSKLAKDFKNLPYSKHSVSLPIELFIKDTARNDYASVEKSVADVSKYQLMSYNNQSNNKQTKKPKRRVIKLGSKKSRKPEKTTKAAVDPVSPKYSQSVDSTSTLVDSDEETSTLSIDTDHQMKNKRALSSSSASVEYLRSLYVQEAKEKQVERAKLATVEKSRPTLISHFSGKDNIDISLKNQSMLGLSLGLSSPIMNNYQKNTKSPKTPKVLRNDNNTNEKNNSNHYITLKLNDKIKNDNGYYKKFSNMNDGRKSPRMEFFTSNFVSDIPPPYVP